MLTDIFAERYLSRPIWQQYGQTEAKLLNQCFRIVSEQVLPYWNEGKERAGARLKWTKIHDRLCMELGLHELSPKVYGYYSTYSGQQQWVSGSYTIDHVCKEFVCAKYTETNTPDSFMKERLSFIELAFRERDEELAIANSKLPSQILEAKGREASKHSLGMFVPGLLSDGLKAHNASLNQQFKDSVEEINERFRRAGAPLNYHNGFIQIAGDQLTEEQIEKVFWEILSGPEWINVDIDMKEAIDRRDSNDRDPAFYAARALESTIKIISDRMGWSHGGERGANSFIENIGNKKHVSFIEEWEQQALKQFFAKVRNPLGHGPGSEEMPTLTSQQTNWAIENSMSWIKSLIQRLP
jgi:AbiJ N-terminal domain 4